MQHNEVLHNFTKFFVNSCGKHSVISFVHAKSLIVLNNFASTETVPLRCREKVRSALFETPQPILCSLHNDVNRHALPPRREVSYFLTKKELS